jgi:hypothetical protein
VNRLARGLGLVMNFSGGAAGGQRISLNPPIASIPFLEKTIFNQ